MHSGQIDQNWRLALVSGLKERYGLAEQEALAKVDQWFERVATAARRETRRRPLRRSLGMLSQRRTRAVN
jgi:hypothetical protein